MESASPQKISEWFANKVNFSVKLPNYQESSGQEKLYTLEGARLVGFQNDYAAYVAYRMKDAADKFGDYFEFSGEAFGR